MSAVFWRELKSYFTGITGYLYTAFVLVFAGIYTMAINLSSGYSQFEYVLESISFIFLIACPILTMRVFAEEKRGGADQLLYSLPISLTGVVLAKYLAMVAVTLLPNLFLCAYPQILQRFGTVYMRTAYASLFVFFLLGAALASIGLFISSVTENQAVSAVVTLGVMLVLYFMSALASYVSTAASASLVALCLLAAAFGAVTYFFTRSAVFACAAALAVMGALAAAYAVNASAFSGLFLKIMEKLSLFDRFYTVVNGVFDLTAVVYYLSIIGVFLFLTVQTLEKRRWS